MIYLNNAATGFPKPQVVLDTVAAQLTQPPIDPHRGMRASGIDPVVACREIVASFFNLTNPNRVVFASNATDALNMAIHGLDLDGSHVVTTAAEHNSVLRPLRTLESERRIRLTIAPCDHRGFVRPADIAAALCSDTRAVVMTQCSNVTGVVQDLRSVAKIVHARGALLVADIAQSAGVIPIDAPDLDVDVLAFTGHKYLHALQGIGGLYVREGLELRPWRVGGTGARSESPLQPENMPMRLEAGTPNVTGVVSLKAGIEFIEQTGLAQIATLREGLIRQFLEGIRRLPAVTLYGEPDPRRSMVALNVGSLSSDDAAFVLENAFSICVRSGLHCAPLVHVALGCPKSGCLRISPSQFTSNTDIDYLLEALGRLGSMNTGRS